MAREFGPRAYRDPAVLRALYLGRGLSIREVAAVLGCGPTTVHDWMAVYGIDRRATPPQLVEARPDLDTPNAGPEGSA